MAKIVQNLDAEMTDLADNMQLFLDRVQVLDIFNRRQLNTT